VSQVLFLLLLGPQFQEYFLTPYFFFKYAEKAIAAANKGLNFSGHTMGTGGLCSRSGRPSAQECPEAHEAPQIHLQGCGCLFLMVEKQEQLEFKFALFATTGK
jgi:hypothetical protein